MSEFWNVEMHSHTLWSKDCITQFDHIIRLCEKRGIDRIAITDHNTADGALAIKKIAPELVIVGEEIMTTHGELLGYFMQETIPAGLPPRETIRRLRDQGAVISVSHPFDRLRKGAWKENDLLEIVEQVDAVEIFNARCMFAEDNVKALQFAKQHHLPGTIGSDAHIGVEYGTAYGKMRRFQDTPEDFLAALREANYSERLSSWLVHLGSKAAKWSKKLHLKPRMWDGG
jgi:predicted metal-dependent phosphoesterase TrpH